MLSLLDNQPANLTIRIGQMWLTPPYQNKKYVAHESMYLVLNWLFGEKYRRVSVETDSRNLIYRKFLERCGFKCEAILRKHRIFKGCKNRDTAMYVILNSEWYKESIRAQYDSRRSKDMIAGLQQMRLPCQVTQCSPS